MIRQLLLALSPVFVLGGCRFHAGPYSQPTHPPNLVFAVPGFAGTAVQIVNGTPDILLDVWSRGALLRANLAPGEVFALELPPTPRGTSATYAVSAVGKNFSTKAVVGSASRTFYAGDNNSGRREEAWNISRWDLR